MEQQQQTLMEIANDAYSDGSHHKAVTEVKSYVLHLNPNPHTTLTLNLDVDVQNKTESSYLSYESVSGGYPILCQVHNDTARPFEVHAGGHTVSGADATWFKDEIFKPLVADYNVTSDVENRIITGAENLINTYILT